MAFAIKNIHNCAIILDWDDTLMATSYLHNQKAFHTDEKSQDIETIIRQLDPLKQAVMNFLDIMQTLGQVFIVTNADSSWIPFLCQKFWIGFDSFLQARHIPVISARSLYEDLFPNDPQMWKYQAMVQQVLGGGKSFQHVMGIGDASTDRGALIHLCRDYHLMMKSFLCQRGIEITDMIRRIQFLSCYLPLIHQDEESVDVYVEIDEIRPVTPPLTSRTQSVIPIQPLTPPLTPPITLYSESFSDPLSFIQIDTEITEARDLLNEDFEWMDDLLWDTELTEMLS